MHAILIPALRTSAAVLLLRPFDQQCQHRGERRVGVAWLTTLVIQVRRRGRRLQVAADRAYPDPLD